ncbi:Hsp20/alpha crystallin family protein [Desulfolutivibrio sp.]|uniref:Hsp20/alpha crystallin family protein n=1 Tax=Desulfolutivibrio sp. TaxID=2773296 RepID=UPI002F96193D
MDFAKLNPWNWFTKEDAQDAAPPAAPGAPPAKPSFPESPFPSLHPDTERFFENAFRNFGFPRGMWPGFISGPESGGIAKPKVDITGSEKEYTVSAELPGIDEKDIHIELKGDCLIIRAEKRQEEKSEDKGYYRVERRFGAFERVLSVPKDADTANIKATCKNGVVTITMPRTAAQEPSARRIAIE